MLRAISSAGCPGRIRETPPLTTLLTYFVPSHMMTSPGRARAEARCRELTSDMERLSAVGEAHRGP